MDDSLPLQPERLLEQGAWVRRLAARLLRDGADDGDADDVAQETFAIALRPGGGPRDERSLRPWLAAVARRVVGRMRRGEARREVRERAAASREALEPTDEIVARAALQRTVVDAVLALPEPYRTTVLQRWFDELPASAIAARRGEPIETVRTRLKRGVALLRERLRPDFGALVLLVEPVRSAAVIATTASVVGATVMTMKVKLVIAAAVIVAGSWAVWEMRPESAASNSKSIGSTVGEAAAAIVDTRSDGLVAPTRTIEPVIEVPLAASRDESKPAPSVDEPPAWFEKLRTELEAGRVDDDRAVGDDLGLETRSAFLGLRDDALDLDALLDYAMSRTEHALILPEYLHSRQEDVGLPSEHRHVDFLVAYENSSGGASVAKVLVDTKSARESVCLELRVGGWGGEIAPEFDHATWIRISLSKNPGEAAGLSGGQIGIYPTFRDNVPVAEKLSELAKEQKVGSTIFLSFNQDGPRMTYARTHGSQSLSTRAVANLNDLFQRLRDQAMKLREPSPAAVSPTNHTSSTELPGKNR